MRDPNRGSAREAVLRVLTAHKTAMTVQAIASAIGGEHGYAAVQQAVQTSARHGEIIREGANRPFNYRARATHVARPAAPATEAASSPTSSDNLSPSVGLVCGPQAIPQNRSQGTIEEALAAILTDRPQGIDEIFVALPIGWSRADAVAGLKEAVLAEWAKCEAHGWVLVGEPPEPSAAPVEAPVSHMGERLQAVRSGLGELLRDAVRLQDAPPLIRCIANAYAEVDAAVGMTKA